MTSAETTTLRQAIELFHRCRHCNREASMNDHVNLRKYSYDPDELEQGQQGQLNYPRELIAAVLRCPGCQHHLCTLLIEP